MFEEVVVIAAASFASQQTLFSFARIVMFVHGWVTPAHGNDHPGGTLKITVTATEPKDNKLEANITVAAA